MKKISLVVNAHNSRDILQDPGKFELVTFDALAHWVPGDEQACGKHIYQKRCVCFSCHFQVHVIQSHRSRIEFNNMKRSLK